MAVAVIFSGQLLFISHAAAQASGKVEPVIVFEHHGLNMGSGRGDPVFSLSLFEDGTVVYEGIYRTRVSGEARAKVDPDRVRLWLQGLINNGVLEKSDLPVPADATWYRLTVVANDRRKSFRFHGWRRDLALIQVLDQMINEIGVIDKWVQR